MFQVIGFWLIKPFSLLIMWEITFIHHQKADKCFIFYGNATSKWVMGMTKEKLSL